MCNKKNLKNRIDIEIEHRQNSVNEYSVLYTPVKKSYDIWAAQNKNPHAY